MQACSSWVDGEGKGRLGNATGLCRFWITSWVLVPEGCEQRGKGLEAKQRDKLYVSIPLPFFLDSLLRSSHQLHGTWLYFICVRKALPCPAGLQQKKRSLFCCADICSLVGLRIGLIVLAALSEPCLCCCFVSDAGAALRTVVAAALHAPALLSQSVPFLCSSGLQAPFISPLRRLQPAFFHLLSAGGNAHHLNCSMRSPVAAGHGAAGARRAAAV